MRILTVTHYQPPHRGGIETVAAAVVDRYRRAGHEVMWLSSDVPRDPKPPAHHVRVPSWNILEETLGVPYPLWHPRAAAVVRRQLEWCDVVHCHDALYLGTVLALRYARRLAKPVLLTQHVAPVPYRSAILRGVQQVAYRTLGRWVHHRVDEVVFISRTVQAWFTELVSYPHGSHFIPNGVDTTLFHCVDESGRRAARATLGLPTDRRVLLFVGRFVDKKGIPIVRAVAERHPDWLFVVLGEGPLDPRSWPLANVRVESFQTQTVLRDYYAACDLLLLPSTGEGFPLVVMEAMACGTPALISGETFAAWDDGREHFGVSDPTADAVDAALCEPSPNAAGTHAEIAAYAHAQWDWDRVTAEYLRLLSDLCKRA